MSCFLELPIGAGIGNSKEAIQSVFGIPGSRAHLTLYQPDGKTEIDVGDSPSLLVAGNSRATPLVVKVDTVETLQGISFGLKS